MKYGEMIITTGGLQNAGNMLQIGSASFDSTGRPTSEIGPDVYFFVSGTVNALGSGTASYGHRAVLGGDAVLSGTLAQGVSKVNGAYSVALGASQAGSVSFRATYGGDGFLVLDSSYGDVTGAFQSGVVYVAVNGPLFDTVDLQFFKLYATSSFVLMVEPDTYTTEIGTYSDPEYTSIDPDFDAAAASAYGIWVVDSIEMCPAAWGADELEIGAAASAIGSGTIAVFAGSSAEGVDTAAIGEASHAEGRSSEALGYTSHAEGYAAAARKLASHAEGYITVAGGNASHAEGAYTEARGDASHAEGFDTTASGLASHTEGWFTVTYGTASHAEGGSTVAAGIASHAEGGETTAIGDGSHAEGWHTLTYGSASHAEGGETTASGGASHAEGRYTTASGEDSHAEGNSTTASGGASHVEGVGTVAEGFASHAGGFYTVASGSAQTVVGQYNTLYNTTSLFVVGSGVEEDRRDVFRAEMNSVQVTGSLYVSGSATFDTEGRSAEGVGSDVYFFVSGTISGTTGDLNYKRAVFGGDVVISGSISLLSASSEGIVGTPAHGPVGKVRLAAGIATVYNSLVKGDGSSLIFVTKQEIGSPAGRVAVHNIFDGSFDVHSTAGGDSDLVAYLIINSAGSV